MLINFLTVDNILKSEFSSSKNKKYIVQWYLLILYFSRLSNAAQYVLESLQYEVRHNQSRSVCFRSFICIYDYIFLIGNYKYLYIIIRVLVKFACYVILSVYLFNIIVSCEFCVAFYLNVLYDFTSEFVFRYFLIRCRLPFKS